jgi:hypothetical protein
VSLSAVTTAMARGSLTTMIGGPAVPYVSTARADALEWLLNLAVLRRRPEAKKR